MERQLRADYAVRRRVDVSAELRRRAKESKEAAHHVRLALKSPLGDGTTTLLDAELATQSIDPEVEGVARRALWNAENNRVTNWVSQAIDPVVMLTAQQNLPLLWHPSRAELEQVARQVVVRGCVYAGAVRRLWDSFFALPARETRRFRLIVWPDAGSQLEEALMAELLCGPVDPERADPVALDQVLRDAQERLICRRTVVEAVLAMHAGAPDVESEVWAALIKVPDRAYEMIEDRDDRPATENEVKKTGYLTSWAMHRAEANGVVDQGLLLAIVKATMHHYRQKKAAAEMQERLRRLRFTPVSPLIDPEAPTGNSALDDRSPPGASVEDAVVAVPDGNAKWLVDALFTPTPGDEGAGPMAGPEGGPAPSLAEGVLRLFGLCHVVTDGDAPGWLATWYVPVTTAKKGRKATTWSLCQAVWPHHVLWGDPDGNPSDRVRRFITDVGRETRLQRPELEDAPDRNEADEP